MTGAFWSTGVICLLTGLVLVSTMIVHPEIGEDILANPSIFTGAALASAAFAEIPVFGTPVLVLGMCAFAYSTILGWSYYGNRCVAYLFGPRGIKPYQVIYVAVAFFGAIGVGDVVWTISDIGNALMAIPNIIVILLLSGMIARRPNTTSTTATSTRSTASPCLAWTRRSCRRCRRLRGILPLLTKTLNFSLYNAATLAR